MKELKNSGSIGKEGELRKQFIQDGLFNIQRELMSRYTRNTRLKPVLHILCSRLELEENSLFPQQYQDPPTMHGKKALMELVCISNLIFLACSMLSTHVQYS